LAQATLTVASPGKLDAQVFFCSKKEYLQNRRKSLFLKTFTLADLTDLYTKVFMTSEREKSFWRKRFILAEKKFKI
jgi:hypothetical protein